MHLSNCGPTWQTNIAPFQGKIMPKFPHYSFPIFQQFALFEDNSKEEWV
jgi:hypothetical protein